MKQGILVWSGPSLHEKLNTVLKTELSPMKPPLYA